MLSPLAGPSRAPLPLSRGLAGALPVKRDRGPVDTLLRALDEQVGLLAERREVEAGGVTRCLMTAMAVSRFGQSISSIFCGAAAQVMSQMSCRRSSLSSPKKWWE